MSKVESMARGTSQLDERVVIVLGGVWGITVVIGLNLMLTYQTTPGADGNPAGRWPTSSRIVRTGNCIQLVMVAHPHCPCTRSSVEALARIIARADDRVAASVLFLTPEGVSRDWERTDLWQSAAAIPGVQVVRDDGGVEGALFGAKTSGQVLLFGKNGQLVFSGGITAGRGHHGDNVGLDQCVAFITGEQTDHSKTPVFGGALMDRSVDQLEGGRLCSQSN